ncbi:FAD-dependent oxidoreductase [Sphingobium sp. Sx8-8]|uniref:NAD(P)/FAD-dependent oxidoreductase n=1 Tax=Sphingobium sp. Sx8-8 TaxID=2933617 RepID=UPI001F55ED5D
MLPVPSDEVLPRGCETVIVGGGVIGVTAALFLAERGHDVVLVEKGCIAGEQSSRNWGWCRQGRRDPREFDLIRESLHLWRGMNARVGGDTGFATCGTFFAARDDSTAERYRWWVKEAAQAGIHAEMAGAATIRALLPGDTAPPPAALHCASDGRAEPQRAVPLMAMAARKRGARIFTGCAARGIETGGGRVLTVVTERGAIACNNVVVAGGAWTRLLLRDLGIDIPQLQVRATVARTQALAGGPECCFWDNVIGLRKRADGGYTLANGLANVAPVTPDSFRFFREYWPLLAMEWRHLRLRPDPRLLTGWTRGPVPLDRPSPYEACRVLDPKPDLRFVRASLAELRRRFPALAKARLEQVWAGMIDAMPDTVPVISPVPGLSGLIVATGFSGHGFGIGPGAGWLVADLLCGARPLVDPAPFRIGRYTDGSNPRPLFGV